jgi:aminopeptidase Y
MQFESDLIIHRWSAEESGLLGSAYYVSTLNQTELDKIRLLLNFDMMASPNYAFQIYDGDGSVFGVTGPPGSAEAETAFTQFFVEEMHQNYTQIEFDGRSDYSPFLEAGVAAGGSYFSLQSFQIQSLTICHTFATPI